MLNSRRGSVGSCSSSLRSTVRADARSSTIPENPEKAVPLTTMRVRPVSGPRCHSNASANPESNTVSDSDQISVVLMTRCTGPFTQLQTVNLFRSPLDRVTRQVRSLECDGATARCLIQLAIVQLEQRSLDDDPP